MKNRTILNHEGEKRLVGINDFTTYLGVGRNTAIKLGDEIGCKIKIGKRTLYDLRKTDQYFNSLTGAK